VEGVTDGENEGDDCEEVIYVGWGEPGGEWTQWGWRNEEGSWFQRWGDAYLDSFPFGELEETVGTPSYYVNEDYPARPVIKQPLPEWSNWRGWDWESSTLLTDVHDWLYTLLVVLARKEMTKTNHMHTIEKYNENSCSTVEIQSHAWTSRPPYTGMCPCQEDSQLNAGLSSWPLTGLNFKIQCSCNKLWGTLKVIGSGTVRKYTCHFLLRTLPMSSIKRYTPFGCPSVRPFAACLRFPRNV